MRRIDGLPGSRVGQFRLEDGSILKVRVERLANKFGRGSFPVGTTYQCNCADARSRGKCGHKVDYLNLLTREKQAAKDAENASQLKALAANAAFAASGQSFIEVMSR